MCIGISVIISIDIMLYSYQKPVMYDYNRHPWHTDSYKIVAMLEQSTIIVKDMYIL